MKKIFIKSMIVCILVVVTACIIPVSNVNAGSTVYYVSTTGDDNNDGSINQPFRTLAKGMTTLAPGDTLIIRGGVYSERVNLYSKKGRKKDWFTVKNYPGEAVVLDSNFNEDVAIKLSDCEYWKIQGLQIREYTGTGIWTADSTEQVILEDLEIYDISKPAFDDYGITGILGDVGNYVTVKNCHIYNISYERKLNIDHGIYIGYGSHHWVIDSNTIHDTPGAGIQFNGAPSAGNDSTVTNNIIYSNKYGMVVNRNERTVISNNTFYNNWYNDLYMDWFVHDTYIQNNIFYNDLPVGTMVEIGDRASQTTIFVQIDPVVISIFYDQVSGNTFRNNICSHITFGNRVEYYTTKYPLQQYIQSQNLNTFVNVIEANPLFVNAANGDFTLQSTSPCIDAGVLEYAPSYDITGTVRDSYPDIGAYEY